MEEKIYHVYLNVSLIKLLINQLQIFQTENKSVNIFLFDIQIFYIFT